MGIQSEMLCELRYYRDRLSSNPKRKLVVEKLNVVLGKSDSSLREIQEAKDYLFAHIGTDTLIGLTQGYCLHIMKEKAKK